MLDHPEEMWSNYYRYYRRRMAPKIDVRIVIAVTISVISVVQYYSAWTNYDDAIKYLMTVPKYRIQATQIGKFEYSVANYGKDTISNAATLMTSFIDDFTAKEEGLLNDNKKANKGKTKEQIKEEEENVIRQIVENKMDIRGGYAKPKITNVLWIQLIFLPWTLCLWIYFYARWFWKFGIMKEDYGEEEMLYVIRKFMKLSQTQFDVSPCFILELAVLPILTLDTFSGLFR